MGRAVVEAVRAASKADGDLFFVSAGLGLVRSDESWPSYDLTVSRHMSASPGPLESFACTAGDWWAAIHEARGRPSPLSELLHAHDGPVLIAIPATYIELISKDLEAASSTAIGKLRLFTSKEGRKKLNERLRGAVLPYDDRLEAVLPGTKNDFPQRAMRHFVETLGGHRKSVEHGHEVVAATMSAQRRLSPPVRSRATDEEIVTTLTQQWFRFGGQSSKLLRYLRDEALVACEQSRFRDLCKRVRDQLGSEAAHG